jgi:hypothetical protein
MLLPVQVRFYCLSRIMPLFVSFLLGVLVELKDLAMLISLSCFVLVLIPFSVAHSLPIAQRLKKRDIYDLFRVITFIATLFA